MTISDVLQAVRTMTREDVTALLAAGVQRAEELKGQDTPDESADALVTEDDDALETVAPTRRTAMKVQKSARPSPVDVAMSYLPTVMKGDIPATATISALLNALTVAGHRDDPWDSPEEASYKVLKSDVGQLLTNLKDRDPRASTLSLRDLLDQRYAEGNGDGVVTLAEQLRLARKAIAKAAKYPYGAGTRQWEGTDPTEPNDSGPVSDRMDPDDAEGYPDTLPLKNYAAMVKTLAARNPKWTATKCRDEAYKLLREHAMRTAR